MMMLRHFYTWLGFMALFLAASGALQAQNPAITTKITPKEAVVGEQLRYEMSIQGSTLRVAYSNLVLPDGLEGRFAGQTMPSFPRSGQLNSVDTGIKLIWIIRATKPGSYTIPDQTIEVNGRRQTAPAVEFTVNANPAAPGGSASGSANSTPATRRPKVWAEFKLERPYAYVGEMVPAHLYVYFDREIQPRERPEHLDVNLEGFTVQNWVWEEPRTVIVDGRQVQRVGYSTAISPAKPGKFKLPPIASTWIVAIAPSTNPAQGDDYFPFGGPGGLLNSVFSQREVPVSSEEVELEVKPLPDQGKPASFNGAIGKFGLLANVNPRESKTGEPLTLRMKITGQGNFGRVTSPWLKEDSAQWKVYAATSNFDQTDELGIEGSKAFEQMIIPQKPTTQLPLIEFSYFDPDGEEYITLKPNEIPLSVTGDPITPKEDEAPAVAPDEKKTQTGLLPLIVEFPKDGYDSRAVFQRPVFWVAQTIPAALLLAFLALTLRQYAKENPHAKSRENQWRRELAEQERFLRQTSPAPTVEVYAAARQALRLQLELAKGESVPDAQLAERLLAEPTVEGDVREDLQSFLDRQAEVTYSGRGADSVSAEERAQLLEFTHRLASALKK